MWRHTFKFFIIRRPMKPEIVSVVTDHGCILTEDSRCHWYQWYQYSKLKIITKRNASQKYFSIQRTNE